MNTIFGLALPQYVVWPLAFLFVLALTLLFWLVLRRIGGRRATLKGQGGARARQPRLGVIDIYDLDRQRQLVLLRRDNIEHLVMIGGPTDVVIESNIARSGVRVAASPAQDGMIPERIDADPVFIPAMPLSGGAMPPVAPPAPSSPLPAPQPVQPQSVAPVMPVAGAAILENAAPAPQRPAAGPVVAPMAAGISAAGSSGAGISGASLAGAAAVAAAAVPAGPSGTPDMAAMPPPAPDPASGGLVRSKANIQVEPSARAGQPPVFPLEPAPPPRPPAADLDDMARQLEQALKRPFAAVRSSAPAGAEAGAASARTPESPPETAKPAETRTPETRTPETIPAETIPAETRTPDIKTPGAVKAPDYPVVSADSLVDRRPLTGTASAPAAVAGPAATPLANDFAALMDEQIKAVVEGKPEAAAMVTAMATQPPAVAAPKPDPAPAPKAPKVSPATTPGQRVDPSPPAMAASGATVAASTPIAADAGTGEAKSDSGTRSGMPLPGAANPDAAGSGPSPGAKETAAPAEPRSADAKDADPFSIDAIEMEFARLLGRDTKPKT